MANEIYHQSNWGSPKKDDWGDSYFNPSATNKLYARSDNYENSNGTDKALASKPDTQSVLMTPTAYSVGSMNSIFPTNGDGNFTFDRNSTATRVNKEGLIETVAIDTPRLDYPLIDGVVQSEPALLLEPTRTNLQTYSSDLDSVYVPTNITQTSNYGVSPDGTLTSTRVVLSNLTDSRSVETLTGVLNNGTTYTFSCYYKGIKGESTYMYFLSSTGGANVSKEIIFTGEWQRESITFTAGSASNYTYIVDVRQGASTATDFEVWGAQVEQGSYPTSYIPTSGSSVTRSAETANGAGTSADFNSSEGVLYAEIAALANDGSARIISISDGTASNRIHLFYFVDSNKIYANYRSGGTTRSTAEYTVSNALEFNKALWKWKSGDFALWINGFEVDTDNNTTMIADGALDELSLEQGDGGSNFYGKSKELAVFKEALTDTELEALTSWDSFSDMATGQEYSIR